MNDSIVLGIDIGGSHITSALVDLVSGQMLQATYVRKFVDSHQAADIIISEWAKAIRQSFNLGELPVSKIGIAMPGPLDYETGVCWIKDQDKYENLYGLNLKKLLAAELQISPGDIRIMNDASCFLHGEVLGALDQQYQKIMGFTLGTGLGSAIYDSGEVTDTNLWNMPFREGIAEDYLSTRWFLKRYDELKGKAVKDVKHLLEDLDHDPVVTEIFQEFGRTLGEFLDYCVKTYSPEVIVLGGNIAKSPELYLSHTQKVLADGGNPVPVVLARLGEEAALVGAAGIWKKVLFAENQVKG